MNQAFWLLRRLTPDWLKNATREFRLFMRFRVFFVAKFFYPFFGLDDLDRKLKKYIDYQNGFLLNLEQMMALRRAIQNTLSCLKDGMAF